MLYTDFVFRILLSLTLGFAIGLERQLTGHTAGIRINVLICMGADSSPCFRSCLNQSRPFGWQQRSFRASVSCAAA